MWSDRNKDAAAGKSPAPNTQAPAAEPARATTRSEAVIGKGMVIKGDIRSKEDMRIDGEVEGKLDVSDCRLIVGREATVGANAAAREIELLGTVRGNLEATSKITIRKGARLMGDLRAPGILIEEGAYVKGKIEIINMNEPAEAAQASAKQRAAGS